MIKAWNKDGEKVDISSLIKQDDEDYSDMCVPFIQMMALVSQEAKEIVTKLEFDSSKFKVVFTQK